MYPRSAASSGDEAWADGATGAAADLEDDAPGDEEDAAADEEAPDDGEATDRSDGVGTDKALVLAGTVDDDDEAEVGYARSDVVADRRATLADMRRGESKGRGIWRVSRSVRPITEPRRYGALETLCPIDECD